MKLGVFVGSFNPVHEGHIKVANYLINNHYVDKVLMLATPNYWDKQDLIELKHRVNMLKFYETENLVVDDIHNKEPFTYQVLRLLRKDYPNDELSFLFVKKYVQILSRAFGLKVTKGQLSDEYINKVS